VKAARPDLFAVQEAVQYVRLDGTTFEPMEVVDHLAILVRGEPTASISSAPTSSETRAATWPRPASGRPTTPVSS
jgi:hypothetical protein